MKRLIIVLVLVVAGIAVLGFTRGWFTVTSATVEDQSNVTVTLDKAKIEQDKDSAVAKVQDVTHKTNDAAVTASEKARDVAVDTSKKANAAVVDTDTKAKAAPTDVVH